MSIMNSTSVTGFGRTGPALGYFVSDGTVVISFLDPYVFLPRFCLFIRARATNRRPLLYRLDDPT
jgi:hypothetical protein